ncbi:hypothetical protein ABZ215_25090 [Amycolatopsis sp. NPDC006131]|uniref:hypothetical protein n=1 Tax=Amycolatopsis sp. NPDC006131 TaxID=3156731 RepID=UPI0033A07483
MLWLGMTARRPLNMLISWEAHRLIAELAKQETNGNVSEMARKLMSEAIAARRAKEKR